MNEIIQNKTGGVVSTSNAGDPSTSLIERAAFDPTVSAEKLERLIALVNNQQDREREIAREDMRLAAELEFSESFVIARSEMPQIVKDAHNDQTKSNYARMEEVESKISPIMAKHGFAVSFSSGDSPIDSDHMHGVAELIHKSSHVKVYEDKRIPIAGVGTKGTRMMTKTHGYGATRTYARRYMMFDIWGISVMEKDSDGNVNNIAISESAVSLIEMIDQSKTVNDLDMMHPEILKETKLSPSDRKTVIGAFSFRRNTLLRLEEGA